MTAILGLLEALEAAILDSPKIPFTDKTIIEETKILEMIDKIRMVLQSGSEIAKESIQQGETEKKVALELSQEKVKEPEEAAPKTSQFFEAQEKANEIIQKAREIARELRFEADKYAEGVLANLSVAVTRILRTLENGRERLKKFNENSAATEKEILEKKEKN